MECEDSSENWVHLGIIWKQGPVTLENHAKENDILDTDRWKRIY